MTPLKMLSTDDKVAEIRRLYFQTTKPTIQADLEKALDLLKSMPSEEDRDRVAVFMDGMAQMRADWGQAKGKAKAGAARGTKTTGSRTAAGPKKKARPQRP